MRNLLLIYVALVGVMSLVAFLLYGWDKYRARANGWRVPEKTLHLLALTGGWPGALAGQKVFRHKTQKRGFQLVSWLIVMLHVAVVGGGVYLWVRYSG